MSSPYPHLYGNQRGPRYVVPETDEASYIAFAFEITVHDRLPAPIDPDEVILAAHYVPLQQAIRLVGETLPWPQMREPLLAYLADDDGSTVGSFYHYDNRKSVMATRAAL